MTTRIWKVTYGQFTSRNVVAPNIKAAINEARKLRKGNICNILYSITDVTLEAESDD